MLIDSKRIANLLSEARKRAGATQEETAEYAKFAYCPLSWQKCLLFKEK